MLVLEENEKCPHSNNCKFNPNGSCHGALSARPGKFTCEFADRSTVYENGHVRSAFDTTGKMQVLTEGTQI